MDYDEMYVLLAHAIVEKAVEDYRELLKMKSSEMPGAPNCNLKELEAFFRSDWFKTLCDLDGEKVLEELKEEMDDDGMQEE